MGRNVSKPRRRNRPRDHVDVERFRRIRRDAVVCFCLMILLCGYTGWAVYSHFVSGVHVHLPMGLLLADVGLVVLTGYLVFECRRGRARIRKKDVR